MKKIITLLLLGLPSLTLAHPGHELIIASQGIIAGMMHPLMGWDHVLVFAAMGILLCRLSGKQAMLMTVAFIVCLALGFYGAQMNVLTLAGSTIEAWILVSMVLSLILLTWGRIFTDYKSTLLLAVFAFFHGCAHGVDAPYGVNSHAFAVGLCISTLTILLIMQKGSSFMFAMAKKQQSAA